MTEHDLEATLREWYARSTRDRFACMALRRDRRDP